MEALSNLTCKPQPHLHFSLPRFPSFHHCPSISGSVSSVFSKTRLSSSTFSIKASISDSPSPSSSSSSAFSLLKLPICIAAISAALFVSRLSPFRPLPALAEAPAVETVSEEARDDAVPVKEEKEGVSDEAEEEKKLQEKLASNPNDVEALKSLLEFKMRNRNLQEVVEIASKLIELEPDEVEWRLLRGHTYCYMGEFELAKPVFEEIIAKDPNKVEAYHGLVMSATQLDVDDGKELEEVEKRIQESIGRLRKENKKADEPRDYRPYLCQGIIYTLLRKKKEADEQFEKYKRLVPKEHPYADYFDHNVKNTAKVLYEAVEK